MKVGRNDPCPCGSKKKYKKCCLGKPESDDSNTHLLELKRKFENYDQLDLISTIGGLQLLENNQAHSIRLDMAAIIACSITKGGENILDSNSIQFILKKYLSIDSETAMLEDTPENLFVENIMFHGGNYLVYPGIPEEGCYILQTLLDTIFQHGNEIDTGFKSYIYAISMSFLLLSNEIARRMEHSRYMESKDTIGEEIEIPGEDEIRILKRAVIFNKQEINDLLSIINTNGEVLSPFISEAGNQFFGEYDPDKNPLFIKPFVKVENDIVIPVPSSIITSLRHHIWIKASERGLTETLNKSYRKAIWRELHDNLKIMSYKKVEINLLPLKENMPIEEAVFSFDNGKYACVQLIVDNAIDYKKDDPFSMWESRNLNETLSQRQKIISEYLLKNGEFHCRNILFIVVLGRIGRSISLARGKLIKNAKELVISAYDLRVVTLLRDCDNLTLWKFSGAKDKFIQSLIVPFIGFSFLDIYSAYIERHHSLYLDDNRKFSIVHINAGYGQPLRIKSIQSNDRHLAQKNSPPKYVSVIRYSLDKSIPIYMIEYSPLNTFGLLIEGYTQPIWVQMKNVSERYSKETKSLYENFIDLLTYWLWQLTPSLRPHLDILGETPYLINIEIKDPEKWSEYGRVDEETNGSITEMRYNQHKRIVEITFSINTLQRLRGADNEGERLILKDLLTLYGEILVDSGFENTLSSEEIGSILERHAPRGLKKKLLLFNTNKNSSLNPNDIPKSRILQEHDVEASLDNLVEALGDKAPPVGSIENKKIGSELCKEIVVIYRDRLRVMLTNYDWKSLLTILIGYHEAILNLIAVKRLRLPTTIECYSNVHTEVKNLAKEFPMVESTAIALRTLIEIIAAEPPNGETILSIDEIDKLLANTYQLFKWASISDQIHYDVFDIKISILPSGRVGIDRDEYLNKWEPFYESKMKEDIELTLRSHKGRFVDKVIEIEDLDDLPKYDEAFRTEFGLSMTQLIELGVSLTDLGFESAKASSHMLMSVLKNELASRLGWDSTDINRGIDFLSLKPRKKWEVPPDGYEFKDIWPWRYNRLLSYLRRPIIIGPEPSDDPIVIWGPRQVEASIKHLLGLVFEGHYQSDKGGSNEMKILIGSILNKAGKQFNIEVGAWLKLDQNLQVELGVSIKPGGSLNAGNDLGDIDVLAIDKNNRIVYSIECKKAKFARNAYEMAHELKNLLDEAKSKDSWIAKHSRRDSWLKGNKEQLTSKFDIQDTSFKIISLIITEVEIPATYIMEVPLPIIPFSRLKREGISLLFDINKR